jgi:methyl-accepting chemotaxis protein
MRGLSIRLTHKILAIGVIGLLGVILVGGIRFYGESVVATYRRRRQSPQARGRQVPGLRARGLTTLFGA